MIGIDNGLIDSRQDVDFVTRQTIGRGVSWLARNHHIKKVDICDTTLVLSHKNILG